jgi:hypothetical protein
VVGARSTIGKRLKNALVHIGRTETTVLLEEPEALDDETIQEDEKVTKAEAERTRPGLTIFTDESRVTTGQRSNRVRRRMAEWSILGGHQDPHGQESRSLRRGVRCIGASPGDSGETANGAEENCCGAKRVVDGEVVVVSICLVYKGTERYIQVPRQNLRR